MLASTATHFSIDVIAMCFLLLLLAVSVLLPVVSFVLLLQSITSQRSWPRRSDSRQTVEGAPSGCDVSQLHVEAVRCDCQNTGPRTRGFWLAFALIVATLLHCYCTVVTQRKLARFIDRNLATLHLIALVITRSVISYKRNC